MGDGNLYLHPGAVLTDRPCDTEIHHRVVAENRFGVVAEEDSTFVTGTCIGQPPAVTTDPGATGISQEEATVSGSANPHGLPATAFFDYGTTSDYGTSLLVGDLGAGISPVPFDATLASLTCGRRYHFRARARNDSGPGYGEVETFFTEPCCGGPHVVQDLFVETQFPIQACETLLIFDSGVEFGGALSLRAGRSVGIGSGLFVAQGATLTVEIDPALRP